MIPFTYNFRTKESTSLLEGIEYISVPWAKLSEDFGEIAKLTSVNGKLTIVLPIAQVVDVTIFSFKQSLKGDIFIDMRAKILNITQFTESFTDCRLVGNVLIFCNPRF